MCSGERGGDEKYDQGKKKNPRKMFISKPKCPRKLSAEREKKKKTQFGTPCAMCCTHLPNCLLIESTYLGSYIGNNY